MMGSTVSHASGQSFVVPQNYDFSISTELNYRCDSAPFVGKYKDIRCQLDYSYHHPYNVERQRFQDGLIDRFLKTKVHDNETNTDCEVPLENWIVFTAGPMGAGKGHTLQWLAHHGLFPFDAFVNVDPDVIRQLLPETSTYNNRDNNSTGYLTQKEVNYISEILSYHSLLNGKNVLVDGSLRNAHWYLKYFKNLRAKFPIIKIAILYVTAQPETVLLRARNRAKVTGRHVPEETILESMRTIPESLALLTPHAEFMATFCNEDHEPEPRLRCCCMQERFRDMNRSGSGDQEDDRAIQLDGEQPEVCENELRMTPLWSLRQHFVPAVGETDEPISTACAVCVDSWNEAVTQDCSYRPVGSARRRTQTYAGHSSSGGFTPGRTASAESKVVSHNYGGGSSSSTGSDITASLFNIKRGQSEGSLRSGNLLAAEVDAGAAVKALHPPAPARPCLERQVYILEDREEGESHLADWKDLFRAVWEMKCALPGATTAAGSSSPFPDIPR